MGAMREAMLREMALRGLAPRTQRAYVGWMFRLVSKTRVPADQLSESQVRTYLANLSQGGLSASTMNQAISAVRFFIGGLIGNVGAVLSVVLFSRCFRADGYWSRLFVTASTLSVAIVGVFILGVLSIRFLGYAGYAQRILLALRLAWMAAIGLHLIRFVARGEDDRSLSEQPNNEMKA
jgi:hypothetical protein